jgi:hypothetical protein
MTMPDASDHLSSQGFTRFSFTGSGLAIHWLSAVTLSGLETHVPRAGGLEPCDDCRHEECLYDVVSRAHLEANGPDPFGDETAVVKCGVLFGPHPRKTVHAPADFDAVGVSLSTVVRVH